MRLFCQLKIVVIMIPGRIFFQSITYKPEHAPKLKASIILNSIFYDEIKPFQTKYLCLTANDFLGIDIQLQDTDQLIGEIEIPNAYKSMVQHQSIDIDINPPRESKLKSAKISLVLQPVSSFARQKLGLTSKQLLNLNFTNNFTNPDILQDRNPHQISFSHRDPLIQTPSRLNQEKLFSPKREPSEQIHHISQYQQGETLQNLANQREKILGELFEKFKKNK